jgi:prolyl 4-hydroxylase
MFFSRGENETVKRIEERIAFILGIPVERGEGLQVLQYKEGAEYRPHYDYFDPSMRGTQKLLERGGQRIGTVIIYLVEPELGGETIFPEAGVSIKPIRGSAVIFFYPVPHPSTKTLHGGSPVIKGEKWIATKWIREGNFI